MQKKSAVKKNFISLTEAQKYCDYSQEYLSLRARQRKLKALKIGRNWVTKKEWVLRYLKNNSLVAVEQTKIKKQKPKIVFAIAPVPSEVTKKAENKVQASVPDDLPIGQFSSQIQNLIAQPESRDFHFGEVSLLGVSLILLGLLFFGSPETVNTKQDLSQLTYGTKKALINSAEFVNENFIDGLVSLKSQAQNYNMSADMLDIAKGEKMFWADYLNWLKTIIP